MPRQPERLDEIQEDIFDRVIVEVPVNAFSLVGGPEHFFAAMGVDKDKKGFECFSTSCATAGAAITSVFPELHNLFDWHRENNRVVMEFQESGDIDRTPEIAPLQLLASRGKRSVQIGDIIHNSCTKDVGFICWVRQRSSLANL